MQRIAIAWHLRKTNGNGTGVGGILFHNDEQIDSANIAGNDQVGVVRLVVVQDETAEVVVPSRSAAGSSVSPRCRAQAAPR